MSKASTEIITLLKTLSADMAEMKAAFVSMNTSVKELQDDNASAAINGVQDAER
jgi:hypothetical protein